ncbi:MAG: NAD-dependent epimerase/dehydratase family protein [Bacteriovoracaceae bacterium]|nr:NAD-dependent epimerase/dehydratase family protein [Bacteriovoracaceae bacterium]
MKFLVTGGCGFIGSHLVQALKGKGDVFVLDNLSTGKKENILWDDKTHFIFADVVDEEKLRQLFDQHRFDYVYHLAAIASVVLCQEKPAKSDLVNYHSLLLIIEMALKYKTKKIIFSSSAAVYGETLTIPTTEETITKPLSYYGVSKLSAENALKVAYKTQGLKFTAFRFFNVYGPRQDPASPYSGVLSLFIKAVKEEREPRLTLFGDGKQTRDFIYVQDVVNALIASLETSRDGMLINLGTGKGVSLLEIIAILEKLTGKKIEIEFKSPRVGDIRHSCAEITQLTKWKLKTPKTIAQGLEDYFHSLL